MQQAMNQEDLLSVIISSYNKQPYLVQCVESVIRQTYRPIEIILVDDCSTDGSRQLIQELEKEHPEIHSVFLPENQGVSSARNAGICAARGSYVTVLDADDFYANERKLENEMQLLKKQESQGIDNAVAFSKLIAVNREGKFLWQYKTRMLFQGSKLRELVVAGKNLHYPREYCFCKKWHEKIGGYDRNMNLYEDMEYLLRLSEHCDFYCTGEVGNAYRMTGQGLSSADIARNHRVLEGLKKQYRLSYPVYQRAVLLFLSSIRRAGDAGKQWLRRILIAWGLWTPKS